MAATHYRLALFSRRPSASFNCCALIAGVAACHRGWHRVSLITAAGCRKHLRISSSKLHRRRIGTASAWLLIISARSLIIHHRSLRSSLMSHRAHPHHRLALICTSWLATRSSLALRIIVNTAQNNSASLITLSHGGWHHRRARRAIVTAIALIALSRLSLAAPRSLRRSSATLLQHHLALALSRSRRHPRSAARLAPS